MSDGHLNTDYHSTELHSVKWLSSVVWTTGLQGVCIHSSHAALSCNLPLMAQGIVGCRSCVSATLLASTK